MNANTTSASTFLGLDLQTLLAWLVIGALAFYVGRNFDQLKARVKEAHTL
jgi:hypothetical protein